MSELYSLKDVAALLSMQEARLRYWAQTGFVGPSVRRGSRFFYTFQDLVGVRAAKELLDRGVPMPRVRRGLDALRAQLPADLPDSGPAPARLRVVSDGDDVVVLDGDAAWEPKSGQLVMSFALGSLVERAAEVLPLRPPARHEPARDRDPAPEPAPATAYGWFQRGLDAVAAGDPARAEERFRRAVELDPRCAAAWTNLGNALEARGARGEARRAYETALDAEPELAAARYNLANLLGGLGEAELALGEYRRVLATAPGFADAHYNLAILLREIGAPAQARVHLQRYLELDPASDWSTHARELLAALP